MYAIGNDTIKKILTLPTQQFLKENPYPISHESFIVTIITAIPDFIMDNIKYFLVHQYSWSWLILLLQKGRSIEKARGRFVCSLWLQ